MGDLEHSDEFSENAVDQRARLYRAISGAIPGGSFVAEYLVDRLPGQRIERVITFVRELRRRITQLEQRIDPSNKYFADLFEQGIVLSSRAVTPERAEQIARAVVLYDSQDRQEWEARKKVLEILDQLTDRDVEVLEAHLDELALQDLKRTFPYEEITLADRERLSDVELFRREARATSFSLHIETLVRLGLLAAVRSKPRRATLVRGQRDAPLTSTPIVSNDHLDDDGMPRIERYRVTITGRLLLGCISGKYPRTT